MAERETREQAQERVLALQAELMERLEKNPKYIELKERWLDSGENCADYLLETMMPQLFDPKYEIGQLIKDIQVNKYLITQYNKAAIQHPEDSEQWAEAVDTAKWLIQQDLTEIKRIKRGEFEWVAR
jgi:SPX domain protein involved in polyphosphate accumulation